ncbi:hypothetical protein PF005_g18854 [Phytophthora fragariae]|uniref:Uncharacterized protein n=1 Tax=Phytophthora fragariae TaxID=53985 RepID=A0A6A3PZP5_9STRA|nr:hypothetical protein PF003_g6277 [Phytophthora fragariae]KAE8920434.1 hypothetical protein PF009_g29270 [Phytophthora fragariae]KAE8969510.1 hypothetical protein PF011_g26772 [Phytophthora fragariae]KAE9064575.1 hypothetical protein PF010_g28552 [Phytophthora fragariae]KAE9065953.1 hypothetical protein PF007_g28663 [Phytophthora fragariae]
MVSGNLAEHSSATDADEPRELSAQPTTPSGLMTTASRRGRIEGEARAFEGGNDAEDSSPRKGGQGGRHKALQHTKNADSRRTGRNCRGPGPRQLLGEGVSGPTKS